MWNFAPSPSTEAENDLSVCTHKKTLNDRSNAVNGSGGVSRFGESPFPSTVTCIVSIRIALGKVATFWFTFFGGRFVEYRKKVEFLVAGGVTTKYSSQPNTLTYKIKK